MIHQQQEQSSRISEKNENSLELGKKITDHFKSTEFPSSGSQQLSASLQALGNKSTAATLGNQSGLPVMNKPDSINTGLAQMFPPEPSPPSEKHLSQNAEKRIKPKGIFPGNELHDKFNANDDDHLMTDHSFDLNKNSAFEESSSLIRSHQNIPPRNSRESQDFEEHKQSNDIEEHKSSQEDCHKTSQDLAQTQRILYYCHSFLGPAAEILISLISEDQQLQVSTFPTPWVNDGLLAFLKSENSGEYLAFLQDFASKETQIEDIPTLLTLLNSDRSRAFPIFSFNALRT